MNHTLRCKNILKLGLNCDHLSEQSRIYELFFCILFARGGSYTTEIGIEIFVNFFVKLLIVCNAYLDGFDFLLVIFVILSVLPLIIGIIYRRKYELLNNLK